MERKSHLHATNSRSWKLQQSYPLQKQHTKGPPAETERVDHEPGQLLDYMIDVYNRGYDKNDGL